MQSNQVEYKPDADLPSKAKRKTAQFDRPRRSRYPFHDGSFFFLLPLDLIDSGLAALMTGAEYKRYVSYLRLSNFDYGNVEIRVSFEQLARMDGISPRRARDITVKLQERGLIAFTRTKPLTVILIPPSCWPEAVNRRPVLRRAGLKVRTQAGPKSWETIL